MANEEHHFLLKSGVDKWNVYWRTYFARSGEASIGPDLSGAWLQKWNLSGVNFCWRNRSKLPEGAYRYSTTLPGISENPTFWETVLSDGADLRNINLNDCNLTRSCFAYADLSGSQLKKAHISNANFRGALLRATDLRCADTTQTIFQNTDLTGADLSEARLSETVFANVNLSATKGLESCVHNGPSFIDHRTLQRSGHLPLAFLRGCGLPDRLIDYLPSLLEETIQYYSCFISYSSKDDAFAKRLHADLQNTGVRCWFAPHDLPIGAKTWDAIDAAIRVRDKLLLILSQNAIASDWVEDEVSKAFAEEKRRGQVVLFPVRIDDTVMKTSEPWAVKLRDQRNIGDFRQWKDHDAYQQAFNRVLRDLKATPG